jgi:hypothetical protein
MKKNNREIILNVASAKQLTRFASSDLQNDILREISLESYMMKNNPEVLEHKKEICEAQGIQGPEYWRGLIFGWRYIECYVEALEMCESDKERLMTALTAPIVGEYGRWETGQDFEADLGNDDKAAFFTLRNIVRKIVAPKKAA